MQQFKKVTILSMIVALFIISPSCTEQEIKQENTSVVSEDIKSQFAALGFDVSDINTVTDDNPLSPTHGSLQYQLEGDIQISEDELHAMMQSDLIVPHHAIAEQYRTTNLVKNNRTIRVLGYTGGSNALDSKMRSGLQMAVANFNQLDIGLSFILHFGTNASDYDITVMRVSGNAGGSSGFPSNGNPYSWVRIYAGTSSYSVDVVEHVITHEMGHSLGLRHTDYFNRSLSCGYGGNEGASGVGAIRVPGTPTGYDSKSIMIACFNATATGEFGAYDRIALEYLY